MLNQELVKYEDFWRLMSSAAMAGRKADAPPTRIRLLGCATLRLMPFRGSRISALITNAMLLVLGLALLASKLERCRDEPLELGEKRAQLGGGFSRHFLRKEVTSLDKSATHVTSPGPPECEGTAVFPRLGTRSANFSRKQSVGTGL
jgi:hypothetical protein